MKHSDIRRNLSAYMDGAVTLEEKTIISEHLESCPECRVALEELKQTAASIRELEEVEPPPWLAPKIMEKAREEAEMKRGVFRRLFSSFPVKLSLEAAALVLVTVTGYLVFRVAQPEMDLVGTMEKKESAKTAPSVTRPSVPVAPPVDKRAKEGIAGSKNEEKAVSPVSPKPLEQNREPVLTEKEAPAPVPEVGFAPAPAGKSVSPGFEMQDMIRGKETPSAPSAQAERSMDASGMAYEEQEERKRSEFAKRKAEMSMAKKVGPGVSFVVKSGEIASTAENIERFVTRLGGRVVKQEWSGEHLIVSILIDAGKLNLLREKLRSYGEVTGSGMNYGTGGGKGETAISIEVEPE